MGVPQSVFLRTSARCRLFFAVVVERFGLRSINFGVMFCGRQSGLSKGTLHNTASLRLPVTLTELILLRIFTATNSRVCLHFACVKIASITIRFYDFLRVGTAEANVKAFKTNKIILSLFVSVKLELVLKEHSLIVVSIRSHGLVIVDFRCYELAGF